MKKLFLCFLLPVAIFAAMKNYSVKATGYGGSYEEAIQNALVRAVEQARGVDIRTRKIYLKRLTQINFRVGRTKGDITIDDSLQGGVYSATQGFIERFELLSAKKIDAKNYKATIKAYFSRYYAPDKISSNKPTLAIIPFATKPSYEFGKLSLDGKALSRRLTNALVTKLTQTEKFTILDRENSRYYELERRFLQDPGSDPRELARIGRRLGADYFLIGQILDFAISSDSNPLIGAGTEEKRAHVTIHYRILNVPFQQVKWADTVDVDIDIPTAKRMESRITKVSEKIAQILTGQILFNIYPPKVIDVSGNRIILNIGGSFLHPGDRFAIYALGKKLYDPYTKESLGRKEIRKGVAQITKVTPKISYAKVVEGKAKRGSILRPLKQEEKQEGADSYAEEMFAPAR